MSEDDPTTHFMEIRPGSTLDPVAGEGAEHREGDALRDRETLRVMAVDRLRRRKGQLARRLRDRGGADPDRVLGRLNARLDWALFELRSMAPLAD